VLCKKARRKDHYCDQRASHQQQYEDNGPTADCQYAEQGNYHEEQDRRVFMLHDNPSFAGIEQLDRAGSWTTRLQANDSSIWVEGHIA
jgi:hypothetical protein